MSTRPDCSRLPGESFKLILSMRIRVWLAQCHPEPLYDGGWLTQNTGSMLCRHLQLGKALQCTLWSLSTW
ncbi:rCG49586 [Rattus norvegicus]|uniref:RCG49586 n=1 Tax=Rattus norvegicus TaxID=10116 RepID=A6J382_RAT|nr:rCG49586 [Rattus norvegicus]